MQIISKPSFGNYVSNKKNVRINCNNISFSNEGATNCYISIEGNQRVIAPNAKVHFNNVPLIDRNNQIIFYNHPFDITFKCIYRQINFDN